MSQQAIARLIERWTNEPGFREQFIADPHGTIVSHGIQLTPEEENLVRTMDWSGDDAAIAARLNKDGGGMTLAQQLVKGDSGILPGGTGGFIGSPVSTIP